MILYKKSLISFFVITLFLLFSSCVTTKRTNYLQEPGLGIPSYPTVPYEEYKLLVGDELNILIYSLDEEVNKVFNQGVSITSSNISNQSKGLYSYTIYEDGTINYPVVGKVYVLGKTLREVSSHLKEQLQEGFVLGDFYVKASLINNNFSVISDAGSGKYSITQEQMTIFQAIATSRDLADFADRAHVKIIRPTLEGTVIKEFDIRSKDLLASEFYYVKPNDVIYVQSYTGQFFRLNSFGTVLSTIMTTITFGLFVWRLTGF